MRSRINNMQIIDKRLLTIEEAAQYLSLGTRNARYWLEEIGASKQFGRRIVYDKHVIDKALDNFVGFENVYKP